MSTRRSLMASERIVLIPAVRKDSTTGFKNVTFHGSNKKFVVQVKDGGKHVHLGYFDTAEEAATAYARSEYGRADAAKLLQPRPAPTAAGAEAIQQATREGLTLTSSSSSSTGYKGVTFCPKKRGSKKYELKVKIGGKLVSLGRFATAERAALFYARREAGRDTSDLTAPPPPPPPPAPSTAAGAEAVRQAEREGLTLATSSSSNSGYKGVTFCLKERGSKKKYKLRMTVGGKQVNLGLFATAEQAALFYAREEAGMDTSDLTAPPPPPPPPPAPSSAAGAEAVGQAEREGLTLATSSSSNSGYKGVCYRPTRRGIKKYHLQVRVGGRKVTLGMFATAEEAALFRARSMAATRQRLGGLPPAFERWQRQQRQQRGAQAESETEVDESETEEDESEAEEEVEAAAGPATASAAQAAPSAGSRLQRSLQRKRPAEACSTDAEVAELGLALARSENQMPTNEREQRAAKRRRRLEREEDAEVAATAEEAEVAGGTAEPDSPQPAHLPPVPPPSPPQPAPWLEAGAHCLICREGSDVDDERLLTRALFCDPSADDGWGYSVCCHNIFHYTCLLAQSRPRQADYATRQGQCDIATDCPNCRGTIPGTRRRMLNRGPRGGEPPRRNESLRAQRARKGV